MILFLSLVFSVGYCQSIVEWNPEYNLQLSDFQSSQTEINSVLTSYSIYPGMNIEFSFQMSQGEFMFTKNFNDKVKSTFNRKAAVITAPDTIVAEQLLQYGQVSFNLTELYARKFRKELYEQKGAFSDVNFFKPIFNKLMEELNSENARVLKGTNFGNNTALLTLEHDRILSEIAALSAFCYSCKPNKKK